MADQEASVGGSPVMLVVHRRLRAAKKKLTRIQELESAQTNGKQLNTDQLATLSTKQSVLASIDELEKIIEPIHTAVLEEVQLGKEQALADASARAQQQAQQQAEAMLEEERAKLDDEWELKLQAMQKERDDARAERKAAEKKLDKLRQEAPHKDKVKPLVEKLVEFFYYSQVFDIKKPTSPFEVESCIAHDKRLGAHAPGRQLKTVDLGELSYFGHLMLDRNAAGTSHKEALERAVDLALQWLYTPKAVAIPASDMGPAQDVTMDQLQRTLTRIRKSTFHTEAGAVNPGPMAAPVVLPPPGMGHMGHMGMDPAVPGPMAPVPAAAGPGGAPPAHLGSRGASPQLPACLEDAPVVAPHPQHPHIHAPHAGVSSPPAHIVPGVYQATADGVLQGGRMATLPPFMAPPPPGTAAALGNLSVKALPFVPPATYGPGGNLVGGEGAPVGLPFTAPAAGGPDREEAGRQLGGPNHDPVVLDGVPGGPSAYAPVGPAHAKYPHVSTCDALPPAPAPAPTSGAVAAEPEVAVEGGGTADSGNTGQGWDRRRGGRHRHGGSGGGAHGPAGGRGGQDSGTGVAPRPRDGSASRRYVGGRGGRGGAPPPSSAPQHQQGGQAQAQQQGQGVAASPWARAPTTTYM